MNSQSNVIKQTAAHPDGHNRDEICVRSRVGTPSDQTRPENFDVANSDHCDQSRGDTPWVREGGSVGE